MRRRGFKQFKAYQRSQLIPEPCGFLQCGPDAALFSAAATPARQRAVSSHLITPTQERLVKTTRALHPDDLAIYDDQRPRKRTIPSSTGEMG
jgi:hypothetical protein